MFLIWVIWVIWVPGLPSQTGMRLHNTSRSCCGYPPCTFYSTLGYPYVSLSAHSASSSIPVLKQQVLPPQLLSHMWLWHTRNPLCAGTSFTITVMVGERVKFVPDVIRLLGEGGEWGSPGRRYMNAAQVAQGARTTADIISSQYSWHKNNNPFLFRQIFLKYIHRPCNICQSWAMKRGTSPGMHGGQYLVCLP